MNKCLLLLVLSLIYTITACKKVQPSDVIKACTIKSIFRTENGLNAGKYYYEFDEKGRIKRVDFDLEKSETYNKFTYTTDNVTETNHLGNSISFNLDFNGRLVFLNFQTLKYNAEGYLTQINNPDLSYSKLHYSNGNLIKLEDVKFNWTGDSTTVSTLFEYNNKPSQVIAGFGNPLREVFIHELWLFPIMGKASANQLVKATVQTSNTIDKITSYSYQENEQGNTTKITTIQSLGTTRVYTIDYQCP